MEFLNISIINGILIGVFSILIFSYIWLKRAYSYWERRGVPHVKPTSIIFGNVKEVFYDKKKFMYKLFNEIYNQFPNEPYCGFYEFHYPILMIRDPQMAQTVMVEKFNSFQKQKVSFSKSDEELLCVNPFVLEGSRWKDVRSLLSVGLTQNRVKALDEIVKSIYKDMSKYIDDNADEIDAYDFTTRFTSEMVTRFGWGIQSEGFSHNSTVKEIFDIMKLSTGLGFILAMFHPFLSQLLNLRIFPKQLAIFMERITKQAIENIEQTNSNQYTLLQALLNTREKYRKIGKDISLSEIAGHLSTLYFDGYDTTSRILSMIIYSLVLHPEVQRKLKEEVLTIGEDVTLESVSKLKYMDMYISECFRTFPLFPFIGRICTEKCKLLDLDVEEGQAIIIPFYAFHSDGNYYPNPDEFNPENFSEENKEDRPKGTFINFGGGPRICPGMRYATANIKLLLTYLLINYDIKPPVNHQAKPVEPTLNSPVMFMAKDPMYISFKKTNNLK